MTGQSCRAFFFFYGLPLPAVRHVETLPRGAASAADQSLPHRFDVSPPKTAT